jgi:hypothetical protein
MPWRRQRETKDDLLMFLAHWGRPTLGALILIFLLIFILWLIFLTYRWLRLAINIDNVIAAFREAPHQAQLASH